MGIREKYWRYSLFVLILGLGVIIFVKLIPFLGGLLGAATIYILVRGQMQWLHEKKHWRKSLAATLLLVESILCFLIPISLVVWMFVSKFQDININPETILRPVQHIAGLIEAKTGYNFFDQGNFTSLVMSVIPRIGQVLMGSITSFTINILVLMFVLYFMLIGGPRMERYINDLLPFNKTDKRHVRHEIVMIVRSNAIGIPLLAVIQGAIAMIGYFIFHAPAPLFFGVLTSFATIIPILGTAIIWAPLAIYMALTDDWANAIGLSIYALIIITHVDNVVRFIMQKRMADTHPLVTIFGVIIGLPLFGFMGVIFGPLMLSMFILCVDIFKNEYLERKAPATPVSRAAGTSKSHDRAT